MHMHSFKNCSYLIICNFEMYRCILNAQVYFHFYFRNLILKFQAYIFLWAIFKMFIFLKKLIHLVIFFYFITEILLDLSFCLLRIWRIAKLLIFYALAPKYLWQGGWQFPADFQRSCLHCRPLVSEELRFKLILMDIFPVHGLVT